MALDDDDGVNDDDVSNDNVYVYVDDDDDVKRQPAFIASQNGKYWVGAGVGEGGGREGLCRA